MSEYGPGSHPIFNDRKHAGQLKDFYSLKNGKKLPTDIDLYFDFQGKFHLIGETKFMGAPLKMGQRIALERLTDDLSSVKPAICVVTAHNNENGDIDFGSSWITEYRLDRVWRKPRRLITFRWFYEESIKRFSRGEKTWPDIG